MRLHRFSRRLAVAVVALVMMGAQAAAADSRARFDAVGIMFDRAGGLPDVLDGQLVLRWIVPGNPTATAALRELDYEFVDAESGQADQVTLRSSPLPNGRSLTQRYIVHSDHSIELQLELPPGSSIELVPDASFIPEPLPGFGAAYGNVRAIMVDASGQQDLEQGSVTFDTPAWVGIRNRFSAAILWVSDTTGVAVTTDAPNQPRVALMPATGQLTLRLYAGPIEQARLRAVDPVLTGMLFAALWDWLRWLCFGMLWLLTTINNVVGHIGWSIVLLSLAVKVLMTPLTAMADRLQASVNRTQALLQPKLDEIKRGYKGEEAHTRTLAVYKELGVSPLYTLKSLAGFLIQIPIFIAAFDMLGENIALQGSAFLWVENLAKPDRWLALPVALPFFGAYLNLLPCLMTGVTLLTSWLQTDANLTPSLLRAQQMRLYLMAAAFFLLFFTFPAGMVLYWTTNNVVHLAKIGVQAVLSRSRGAD